MVFGRGPAVRGVGHLHQWAPTKREAQSPSIDWAPLEVDTGPRSWPGVADIYPALGLAKRDSGLGRILTQQ